MTNTTHPYIYVAFDVDGTLIHTGWRTKNDDLNLGHAQLLILLSQLPNVRIIVWSGGGQSYAEQQVRRFGLENYVWRSASKLDPTLPHVSLAFDDEPDFNKATVNIAVPFSAPRDEEPTDA